MARMAESMLRALGGGEVTLLLPISEAADTASQRLGLAPESLEQVPCAPVVVRSLSRQQERTPGYELLFPASLVLTVSQVRGISTAEVLFTVTRGVLCGNMRLRVHSAAAECFAGKPYLYRVTCTASA
jgi:hypothetical protein